MIKFFKAGFVASVVVETTATSDDIQKVVLEAFTHFEEASLYGIRACNVKKGSKKIAHGRNRIRPFGRDPNFRELKMLFFASIA
jgi:hypothetical protein